MWAFVMVLSWSRSIYVEFIRRADTASFIQGHVNAFDSLGGVPRGCLYDNARVVTLGRGEEGRTEWNRRMLDFALRLGFDLKLCQPYRAQTKGKVESGVKYVRGNLWPSLRFTDDADLNRQELELRRGGQRQGAWHHLQGALGDAGRGAASPGRCPTGPPWRPTCGRTARWPGTASSAGRDPPPGHCPRWDISHEQLVWPFMLAIHVRWYTFLPPQWYTFRNSSELRGNE